MGLSGSRHQLQTQEEEHHHHQQLVCSSPTSLSAAANTASHARGARCLPKRGRHHVVHWDNLPQAIRMRVIYLAACPSTTPTPSSSSGGGNGSSPTFQNVCREDLRFIVGLSTVSRGFNQDVRAVLDAVCVSPLVLLGRDKGQMIDEEEEEVSEGGGSDARGGGDSTRSAISVQSQRRRVQLTNLLFWTDVWMCYRAADPNIPKSTFWRRSKSGMLSAQLPPTVQYSDLMTNFLIVHCLNRQMALLKKEFTVPWKNEDLYNTASAAERIRTEVLNYNGGVEMLADTLAIWPVWSFAGSSSSSSSSSYTSSSASGVVGCTCGNGRVGGDGGPAAAGSLVCSRCLGADGSPGRAGGHSGGEEGHSGRSRGMSPRASAGFGLPKRSAGALAYGLGFPAHGAQHQRNSHHLASSSSMVMSGRLCCCLPAAGHCSRVDVLSPGRSFSAGNSYSKSDHNLRNGGANARGSASGGAYLPAIPDVAPKEFRAAVLGAPGTPYAGGIFFLKCKLPSNYPFKAPRFRFLTPFYHPLVSSRGEVHVDDMGEMWTPSYDLRTYLVNLMAHLYDMDPCIVRRRCLHRTPPRRCNRLVAEAFCERPETFKENVRQHTKKHAVCRFRNAVEWEQHFDKLLYRATAGYAPKLQICRFLQPGHLAIDEWTSAAAAAAIASSSASSQATATGSGTAAGVRAGGLALPRPPLPPWIVAAQAAENAATAPADTSAVGAAASDASNSAAAGEQQQVAEAGVPVGTGGVVSTAEGGDAGGSNQERGNGNAQTQATTAVAAAAASQTSGTAAESKIRVRIAQRIGGDSRVYKVSRKFTLAQIERKLRNRVRYGHVIRDTDAWVFAGTKMNADLTLPEAGVQDGDLVLRLAWH
ncbi:hypothetical protein CBR_g63106 [Chara braunii]|uniref:UBC core domain-containing protein n=1 Tax=Chara braunii TaxID=69332 RepID=A0A388K8X4_CHABU|nr:hypothetical protein CBR_g63106 [Chara braunii]|eukprot:GBG66524.1 hypothetical protein CBR_g63106 [Chara braunii]